jgi:hypothetical protein
LQNYAKNVYKHLRQFQLKKPRRLVMVIDWIQSILIVSLFSAFLIVDTFNSSVQSVQDNWSLYRCNPVMLPFASYFSPSPLSTSDNFSYCVQSMMANFAPSLTQPFSYLQSMTVDMMGSINDNMMASTSQSSALNFNVSNIFESIYGVFLNTIIEFNIIIIKIMDTQGKISGVITTLMYIMTAVQYTFESMWNGIPGKMIQTIGKL